MPGARATEAPAPVRRATHEEARRDGRDATRGGTNARAAEANRRAPYAVPTVHVRPYKPVDLKGSTLVVSVPHVGMGNILLTDHMLEALRMDQVAVVDSDAFPPFAIVREGKPRYPVRIHASADPRVAVLRCEFTPSAFLARPLARAVLDWACEAGFERAVVLDGVRAPPSDVPEDADALPPVLFSANGAAGREAAVAAGVAEFPQGILGGVTGLMLLEGRFCSMEVVALLAELRSALDDARSVLAFARVLPRFVPDLRLDAKGLAADLKKVETAVSGIRAQAQRAVRDLAKEEAPPGLMYG